MISEATTTQFLERPEGRLAWDLAGKRGPLVVCVPSMGDVRAEYRSLAPKLVEAGFRVATLDVRGHGESSVGWKDHSSAAIGSDLVALLDSLDEKGAFIVGTSMAAAAAVWAAAERPERIAGIALVGPFVRDIPISPVLRLVLEVMMLPLWGRAFWKTYYRSLYPSAPPADLDAYRERLVANLREPGRFEALRAMMGASKADCEARIPNVRARSLVLMGTKDPDFKDPAAEAKLVAERLRGTVKLVDGAGHYPHAEYPDVTAAHLVEFFDGR